MAYDTKRYQFELPASGTGAIDEMKHLIGAKTNGDLFDNALTLLHWAITNVREGRMITSMDENEENYRVLTMPALERARNAASVAEEEAVETTTMSNAEKSTLAAG
ncbi:MAG: hypothetical protein AAFW68_04600 [Pseudomonadota bacterium]